MIPGSCSLLTFESITFLKHSSKMQNCIYPEYGDTLTPYHTCTIIRKGFCHNLMCLKITEQLANSVDPDRTLHYAVSDIGLHCLLRHVCPNTSGYVCIQLILAYSWARPAILVAGKGRWGIFLFLLFLHFHSCSSFFPVPLFHLFYYLFYHFSPFLWEMTQNDPQGLTCR